MMPGERKTPYLTVDTGTTEYYWVLLSTTEYYWVLLIVSQWCHDTDPRDEWRGRSFRASSSSPWIWTPVSLNVSCRIKAAAGGGRRSTGLPLSFMSGFSGSAKRDKWAAAARLLWRIYRKETQDSHQRGAGGGGGGVCVAVWLSGPKPCDPPTPDTQSQSELWSQWGSELGETTGSEPTHCDVCYGRDEI